MDKKALIKNLILQISNELEALKLAAQSTYNEATHEESRAENKYDTRGLEASYLAGAQAKRVDELSEALGILKTVHIREFERNDPIALTALVQIKQNEKRSFLLIMPKAGGQSLQFENQTIQVITPQSPLGALLIGKRVDDEIELHRGNTKMLCEILTVQ